MPTIPPWLQPPDVAGEYARGLALGSQIGESQNRLAQEDAHARMQLQMHQQQLQQQQVLTQQRLATMGAYHDQQVQLRRAALDEAAEKNAQATREAALKMADQTGFAQDLAKGMPIEQALYNHPRMTTPTAAINAHKAALSFEGDRVKQAQQRLDLSQKALDFKSGASERRLALAEKRQALAERTRSDMENKPGTMDIPLPPTSASSIMAPTMKNLRLDDPLINKVMGTNAPTGTGTNYVGRGISSTVPIPSMGAAPAPAAGKSPFQEGAIIRSKKDGKRYIVDGGVPRLLSDNSGAGAEPSDDQGGEE